MRLQELVEGDQGPKRVARSHAARHTYFVACTDAPHDPSAPVGTWPLTEATVIDPTCPQYCWTGAGGVMDVASHNKYKVASHIALTKLGVCWSERYERLVKNNGITTLWITTLNEVLLQVIKELGGCKYFFQECDHSYFIAGREKIRKEVYSKLAEVIEQKNAIYLLKPKMTKAQKDKAMADLIRSIDTGATQFMLKG
jgi:hypothetical protein